MDYVVFGTGYGATLMLLGWAIRMFGPGLRYQSTEDDGPQGADVLMARLAWRRFISALGAVIATSGVLLVLITFLVILIDPGDSAGAIVGWTCFGLILLAVAAWSWFFVGRYGTFGVLPPRQPVNALKSPTVKSAGARVPAAPLVTNDSAEPVMVAEGGDDHDFGPEFPEAQESGEYTARYAKYQLHRPEDEQEPEESSAYAGLFSEVTDDDFDVEERREESLASISGDAVSSIEDLPEADFVDPESDALDGVSATSPEISDDLGVPEDDVSFAEPDTTANDPVQEHLTDDDVPPSALDTEGAEEEESGPEPDDVAEDVTSNDMDADHVDPAPMLESDDEPAESDAFPLYTSELEDTPEGRAEALRRIQEWQPADRDGDPQS